MKENQITDTGLDQTDASPAIPMPDAEAGHGPVYSGTRDNTDTFTVSLDKSVPTGSVGGAAMEDGQNDAWLGFSATPESEDAQGPPPASPPKGAIPGPADKSFSFMARLGLLIPLILLALQTCFVVLQPYLGLDLRSLWFSDEIRHGAAYEAMKQTGEWFILTLNGNPYPDKPPLYFWFLYALDQIPTLDPPRLFLVAAALSGLLLMAATWLLARGLGYDKKISFAACLVLLSSFSFLGIVQYARMDLLFAALITFSHLCLYRGWVKKSAPLWLLLGFAFAALACLVKGPLGIAFPLISSILFLMWRGTFQRAGGRDGALGFGVMLIILLAWATLVFMQEGGKDYLSSMLGRHVIERALDAWHHKQPWWFYGVNFPIAWLPWTLLILFLPWERLPRLAKGALTSRQDAPGHGWVWISLASGFVLLSVLSGKVGIYTLPLYPFLAILTAQGILSMGPRRSKGLYLLFAILLIVLALLFGFAGSYHLIRDYLPDMLKLETHFDMSKPAFQSAMDYIMTLKGLPIVAGVCLVFGILLAKGTRRAFPGGSLLVLALFFTVLAQPLAVLTAPSLDTLMSPRPQAQIMKTYEEQGFHVTAFYVTTGTYTYYMGGVVDEVNEWDQLAERIAAYPRLVVATRLTRWKEWQEKPELDPESFRVLNTQWIAERQYVILVRDSAAPAVEIPEPEPMETPTVQPDPEPIQPEPEPVQPEQALEEAQPVEPAPVVPEEPQHNDSEGEEAVPPAAPDAHAEDDAEPAPSSQPHDTGTDIQPAEEPVQSF